MLDPRAEEGEIKAYAVSAVAKVKCLVQQLEDMREGRIAQRTGAQRIPETGREMERALDAIAREHGARPVADKEDLGGRVARMLDRAWWVRNLRRELLRENERIEFAQCRIRRKEQVYVSDWAMAQTTSRARINRETLEGMEVVNEDGEAYNLLEISDQSESNPALRRAGLMVRCRGFEDVAKFMHHSAALLTLTAPSRFHRFDRQGKPNPRWKGASPDDAQEYLNGVWQKIRSEWKRRGYMPYGFRVAEPHHDGCPHWHMLIFAPEDQMGWFVPHRHVADRADHGAGLIGVAGDYAMRDSGGEPGATKYRFNVKTIDPTKGGATGYIAKYISKNIDGLTEHGESMGLDRDSGKSAAKSARRVRAWASLWGIRQFQPIGGPSVTVFRELRALGKDRVQPLQRELFEGPRAAADRSLWSLFWILQGGPEVPRRQLTLKPFYIDKEGAKYGGEIKAVRGVLGWDSEQKVEQLEVTRMHEWTIQRAGRAEVESLEAERWENRRIAARVNAWAREAGFASSAAYREWDQAMRDPSVITMGPYSDLEFQRSEASTWTSVNNCTEDSESDEAAALEMDFLRGGVVLPTGEISNARSNDNPRAGTHPPSS